MANTNQPLSAHAVHREQYTAGTGWVSSATAALNPEPSSAYISRPVSACGSNYTELLPAAPKLVC